MYEDIAERMLGDIDFLVSQEDFENTVEVLKKEGYSAENEIYMDFHWHYPKMVKKNRIAAVEVHKKVLKKPYTSYLDYETLIENSLTINNCRVASFENQSLVTVLQKQINDNLYFSKTIPLRNLYDIFLLSVNVPSKKRDLKNKTIKKYLNNYKICAAKLLNSPKSIEYTINNESTKYLESYLKIIENSKNELRKIAIINSYIKIKDKFKILQYSFIDKEYQSYTFRRLKNFNFYLKNLGIKKSKPKS